MQEKVSNASFALLGRKYLQPSSHVPATVLARTCNRPRTYLQASLHVLASVLARTCDRPRTYLHPSSHVLAGKRR